MARVRPARNAHVRARTLRVFPVALLLAATAAPIAAADAVDPAPEERAAALARPAIVYVEAEWEARVQDHDGDWLPVEGAWRCTGFVVNPAGYVATAGHCAEGVRDAALLAGMRMWLEEGWIEASEAETLLAIAVQRWKVEGKTPGSEPTVSFFVQHGKASAGMTTGQAWPARLVEAKAADEGDVALLKVEQADLPTLELAEDVDVNIGTPIMAVGYPGSTDRVTDATLEPTFKDGKVSSKKTRGGGLVPVYEISAAVSEGMSGGPTIDLEGRVVGVNSFKVAGEEQSFNFVAPSSLLAEMLARNGVENKLGPVDALYREALDLYFAGDHQAAIEQFDAVLARVPSHQQAQEFRIKAVNAEAEADTAPTEAASTGLARFAVRGVVAAALAAVGALFLRRRAKGARGTQAADARTATLTSADESSGPVPVAPHEATAISHIGFSASGESAVAAGSRREQVGYCTSCGTALSETGRFCAGCGQATGMVTTGS